MIKPRKIATVTGITVLLLVSYVTGFGMASVQSQDNGAPSVASATAPVMPSKPDLYELWQDVNKDRTDNGLPALSLNPRLNASAEAKCADMVANNYWSHDAPDGTEPWSFIHAQGFIGHMGENLAKNYDTANGIDGAWLNSPEHRANIVDSYYSQVGYALCNYANGEYLVVQHFGQ